MLRRGLIAVVVLKKFFKYFACIFLPAVISFSCMGFLFAYFVYPSLSSLSAYLKIDGINSEYILGDKLFFPAEIVNTSHRASYFLIFASVRSPAGAAKLPDKIFYINPGEKKRFYYEFAVTKNAPVGAYRLRSKVKVKRPGHKSLELSKVEKIFTVKEPVVIKKPAVEYFVKSQIPKKTAKITKTMPVVKIAKKIPEKLKKSIPLLGEMEVLGIEGHVKFDSPADIKVRIKNTSEKSGSFKVLLRIVNPILLKEEVSARFNVGALEQKIFSIKYSISDDSMEGRYSVSVEMFAEERPMPVENKSIEFSLVDRLPMIKFKSIDLSKALDRKANFMVEISDDRLIKEVFFISRDGDSRDLSYNPMKISSGTFKNGVWVFGAELLAKSGKFNYSVMAIDSKGQKMKTPERTIGVITK